MPTTPRQFRLAADTLAALDRIAEQLYRDTGLRVSRADAIRAAVAAYSRRLDRAEKNLKKNPG